jgi:ACT domain-containing protein
MPDERQYYYKITRIVHKMKKTIITVVGKDTVGIIAKVCTYLAENQVNVEDISQTIVQGYFNMMMIVDTEQSEQPFSEIVTDLENLGNEIGVRIRCQREDIFTKMHRI